MDKGTVRVCTDVPLKPVHLYRIRCYGMVGYCQYSDVNAPPLFGHHIEEQVAFVRFALLEVADRPQATVYTQMAINQLGQRPTHTHIPAVQSRRRPLRPPLPSNIRADVECPCYPV